MKRVIKLLKYLLLITILFLPIGFISSFTKDFDNFSGVGHSFGACHKETVILSQGGTVNLTLKEEGDIETEAEFTVVVTVIGFMEAAEHSILIGFASGRANNGDFEFDDISKSGVEIDSSGDSSAQEFDVTAPSTDGEYILTADALDDDTSATGPLNWTFGSLEITVIAAEDDTEVDLIAIVLFGTIASVGALVLVSSLVIKYSLSRRRVIQDE